MLKIVENPSFEIREQSFSKTFGEITVKFTCVGVISTLDGR